MMSNTLVLSPRRTRREVGRATRAMANNPGLTCATSSKSCSQKAFSSSKQETTNLKKAKQFRLLRSSPRPFQSCPVSLSSMLYKASSLPLTWEEASYSLSHLPFVAAVLIKVSSLGRVSLRSVLEAAAVKASQAMTNLKRNWM